MSVTIPVDAVDRVVEFIQDTVIPAALPGWKVGTKLTAGVTPDKYIRVTLGSSAEVERLADQPDLRFQLWQEGGDKTRTNSANILLAHLRAGLVARKTSGPNVLPDPANAAKSLVQFTTTLPPQIGAQA